MKKTKRLNLTARQTLIHFCFTGLGPGEVILAMGDYLPLLNNKHGKIEVE